MEERRERLRNMLQQENAQLEDELRASGRDRSATLRLQQERAEDLRSAREERRKKVMWPAYCSNTYTVCTYVNLNCVVFSLQLAQELLKEHWKTNNPEVRRVSVEKRVHNT